MYSWFSIMPFHSMNYVSHHSLKISPPLVCLFLCPTCSKIIHFSHFNFWGNVRGTLTVFRSFLHCSSISNISCTRSVFRSVSMSKVLVQLKCWFLPPRFEPQTSPSHRLDQDTSRPPGRFGRFTIISVPLNQITQSKSKMQEQEVCTVSSFVLLLTLIGDNMVYQLQNIYNSNLWEWKHYMLTNL